MARAQGTEPAALIELQRGERALSHGDAAAAIPSLEMAYLLRPGPRALRLLIEALVKERRHGYALECLGWLRVLSHGPDRDVVERQIAEITQAVRTHVRVVSEPEGATVYLDGQTDALGQTPLYATIPPGPHQLVVTLTGRVSRTLSIDIPPGGEGQVQADLALYGCDLSLMSEPEKAQVRVLRLGDPGEEQAEEVQKGAAPLGVRVPPGRYRIEMALPGRAPLSQPLLCRGDEVLALRGVLPALPLGRLTVAAPPGASVLVDFCPGYGQGVPPRCAPAPQPLSFHGGTAEMLPGRHRIEVRWEGHQPWQGEGEVLAGQETVVTVPLLPALPLLPVLTRTLPVTGAVTRQRPASRSRKALLWTVAGVAGAAVLGGIAAAVVLTAGRGPAEPQFPAVLVR